MKTIKDNLKIRVCEAAKQLAQDQINDIASGVEDGTYDDSKDNMEEIRALEAIIKDADELLGFKPEIKVRVEGGVLQGASADIEMTVEVYDVDCAKGDPDYVQDNGTIEEFENEIRVGLANNTLTVVS